MNGKQQLMRWVSVSVLVVTALLSTATNVGAIYFVDPTPAGMATWERFSQYLRATEAASPVVTAAATESSWTRYQQYQAAMANDLAALEAISNGESSGASRGLASARPVVTTAATESSLTRFQQYQAAVENDLATLEAISHADSNIEWERFSQYLWASGVTR